MMPVIGWSPVRLLASMLTGQPPDLSALVEKAKGFGFGAIEFHHAMLPAYDRRSLDQVAGILQRHRMRLSMLTCAPDFTHPDAEERERQLDEMKTKVVAAWVLGAEGVRVTVGCAHWEVTRKQGIAWAVEMLTRLAEFAAQRGVKLGLENHYKDRLWQLPDFAFEPEVFLEVVERLKGVPIGINFDCANPVTVGYDPMTILRSVADRIWHVHVSDRKVGDDTHQVLGEGDVPLASLLTELARLGYRGVLSLEDGQGQGDEGTRRSLAYLQTLVQQCWAS